MWTNRWRLRVIHRSVTNCMQGGRIFKVPAILRTSELKVPLIVFRRHLSPALQAVVDRFVKRQSENGHRIIEADGGGQEFLLGEEESDDAEEVEVPKALGDIFESVAGAVYLGRLNNNIHSSEKIMKEAKKTII